MTIHTFTMTERYAAMIHEMAKDKIGALHNYIASAVERGEMDKASGLVFELRDYQDLFAAFNVYAWHTIADGTGKPLETEHSVYKHRS